MVPHRKVIRQHRLSRGLMYCCFVLAGIGTFFLGIPFLADLVSTTIIALGVSLIIGGGLALMGHILRSPILERAGYPLILAAVAALTIVLFAPPGQSAPRSFVGLLIMALGFGLYGRYRDLKLIIAIQRESDEYDERHGDDPVGPEHADPAGPPDEPTLQDTGVGADGVVAEAVDGNDNGNDEQHDKGA